MKTDDLVLMLATGAGAADPAAARRRWLSVMAGATLVAMVVMFVVLGLNPLLDRFVRLPLFWVREAFCAALALGGLAAAARLGRPGAPLTGLQARLLVPLAAMGLLGAGTLLVADPADRAALLLGSSWTECSLGIALLSLPVFAATIWWMRGLAPTRLRLAGAAAGFAAGAMGALVYTLHCPEVEAPFVATWYVLGMLLPAALGALLGPRLLRW